MLRQHSCRLMIHGHTHRPAIHDFTLDGRAARRIVLGDWFKQGRCWCAPRRAAPRHPRSAEALCLPWSGASPYDRF